MIHHDFKKYTIVNFLFQITLYLVSPVLGPYLKSLGYSDSQLGLIFAIYPLAVIMLLPILGRIADDIGKKRVILFGIFLELVSLFLYLYSGSYWIIALARFLNAISVTTLTVITLSKVEDLVSNKNRGKFSGEYLSIGHLGHMIAPLVGGFLANTFSMRFPFFVSMCILALLFLFLSSKKDHHLKNIHKEDFNWIEDIKVFLEYKDLRILSIVGMAAHAMGPVLTLFLPIYVVNSLGLDPGKAGIALFVYIAPYTLQFFFGKYDDKYSSKQFIILGLLIKSLGFFMIYFASTFQHLIFALFFFGIGGSMWNVSAWTFMSNIGESIKQEALVTTSYLSLSKIGALLSYLISGFLIEKYSFNLYCLILSIIMIILTFYAYYNFDNQDVRIISND